MRQGQNTNNRGRPRSRNGSSTNNNNNNANATANVARRPNIPLRHQTFDSNGPDVRIRGNAFQVHEKYLALARDASSSGDRIAAENYLQHAEHYFRIISQINEAAGENQQRPRNGRPEGPNNQPSPPSDGDESEGEEATVEGRVSGGL